MSLPDPRRPVVGDTYTLGDTWTTEVLAVTRSQITIRLTPRNGEPAEGQVTPDYFAETRSVWTPKERAP